MLTVIAERLFREVEVLKGLVVKLADTQHLKCCDRKIVRVRPPPGPHFGSLRSLSARVMIIQMLFGGRSLS